MLTNLLTVSILFSTVVNAVFVAKSLILGIFFSNSVSFAFLTKSVIIGIFIYNSVLSVLYLVFNTKSLVSILFTLATNSSYVVFLTTSFFTALLSLVKSVETGTFLSMCNLSTSAFKLAKFVFNAKIEVSACVTFFKLVFVA